MAELDPKYISAWRSRFEAIEAESKVLVSKARNNLTKAIPILMRYGAKRIILFGSLCRKGRFHPDSDIDLAVEGISLRDFTRVAADLMMALDWSTDLKPLEEMDEFLRTRVIQEGEILYEE